jgi:hypothetical protein
VRTNDQYTFFQLGELDKGSQSEADNRIISSQLRTYLRNLSSLSLSDKGRANICNRFKVTAEELTATLATLQRPSAPSDELLATIRTAVTRTKKGNSL